MGKKGAMVVVKGKHGVATVQGLATGQWQPVVGLDACRCADGQRRRDDKKREHGEYGLTPRRAVMQGRQLATSHLSLTKNDRNGRKKVHLEAAKGAAAAAATAAAAAAAAAQRRELTGDARTMEKHGDRAIQSS